MKKRNEEKAYSGGRQLLLRLALMIYDIFAVNISYFLALLIRLYVGFRFIELQTGSQRSKTAGSRRRGDSRSPASA